MKSSKYVSFEKGNGGTRIRTETSADRSTDGFTSANLEGEKMGGGDTNLGWETGFNKPASKGSDN